MRVFKYIIDSITNYNSWRENVAEKHHAFVPETSSLNKDKTRTPHPTLDEFFVDQLVDTLRHYPQQAREFLTQMPMIRARSITIKRSVGLKALFTSAGSDATVFPSKCADEPDVWPESARKKVRVIVESDSLCGDFGRGSLL